VNATVLSAKRFHLSGLSIIVAQPSGPAVTFLSPTMIGAADVRGGPALLSLIGDAGMLWWDLCCRRWAHGSIPTAPVPRSGWSAALAAI
jgi:hypothetical protein